MTTGLCNKVIKHLKTDEMHWKFLAKDAIKEMNEDKKLEKELRKHKHA